MASSLDECTFFLSKPVDPEALSTLRAGIASALEDGAKAVIVDIDGVGTLDSPAIGGLILALRAARERSAVLSLRVSRKNLLETLRITALYRVFPIVTPLAAFAPPQAASGERSPRKKAARPKRSRFVAAVAGALLLAGTLDGRRAAAQDAPVTPAEAIHNVLAQSDRISSYQATIGVDIHLRSFPYLAQHLDGTTYFKRPDNFEIVFRKVPSYATGFDKLYSDIDDPTSWERRFVLSVAGEKLVDGHRDMVVRLVQRVRGMIDHEDVAIDTSTWRIDSMEWHYYNGGFIAMSQEYQDVGGYSVLATQHATIRIPYVHAAADAVYSDYKTNVAIDDSVFTKAKHP